MLLTAPASASPVCSLAQARPRAPPARRQRRAARAAATTTVVYTSSCSGLATASGGLQASESLVTLTTQCSVDRLPRIAEQAESWGGPVSLAVYLPQSTAGSQDQLQKWAAQYAERHPAQALHVSALLPAEQDNSLYPINALRNLALRHASTPLVLPVDGDFILSQGLEQQLHAPDPGFSILPPEAPQGPGAAADLSVVQQLLLCQQQQPSSPVTLVLPAFQLVTPQQQQQQGAHDHVPDSQRLEVPRGKAQLLQALREGRVQPFDCGVFAPEQQPLDVSAWATAQELNDLQFVDLFEVHGGVSVRQQLPPYSEAFRGYGLNKQQHAWHSAALGFTFKVLPDAFMVTAPHKRSISWRPTPGTAADTQHLETIRAVYAQFKQQLAEQGLVPPGCG